MRAESDINIPKQSNSIKPIGYIESVVVYAMEKGSKVNLLDKIKKTFGYGYK